jgi:hypothetical protein
MHLGCELLDMDLGWGRRGGLVCLRRRHECNLCARGEVAGNYLATVAV